MNDESVLGFALLGLLEQQPMSGYDLRKIFASSAMGSFSDSPGAIYPALGRLEERGLVRGTLEGSSGLRRRRVYRVTPKGAAAFKAWLKKPVTRDDVVRHSNHLMLRFAFMDLSLGAEHAVRFLRQLSAELKGYLPGLRGYLAAQGSEMPLSSRLALEFGMQQYKTLLKWAKDSIALYERGK
ncbi:MAG TPA: PadR family transcriptional regulator [Acidobacteriaceae bacterium]|nr:PadR family transcriptional regulator [Acidobacteriaceae bacterium]